MSFERRAFYAAVAVLAVAAAVMAQNAPLPKGKGVGFGGNSYSFEKISKMSSKIGGGFSGHLLGMCKPLQPPKQGGISCSSTARRMTCTATCLDGFNFPDKSLIKKHVCSNSDGTWTPSAKIINCEPVCDPRCENGGQCFGRNHCVCPPDYRGETCQFPVSNCVGSKLHQTGGYSCNHTSTGSFCIISCPPGTEFEYPPATVFQCDLTGNWLPKDVPKCIPMKIVVHATLSPVMESLLVTTQANKELKEGVCSTWGQLHYRTFDGMLYSAQGQCTYLLAKDCVSDTFSIHVQNDPDCNNVKDCFRRVFIYINRDKYTLTNSGKGAEVYWGSNRLKTPTAINGLLFEEVAHYVVVRSVIGFILRWNGMDSISIEVSSKLINKTCGLCGRYDGYAANDFTMLGGAVAGSMESFINSWKMNDANDACPDSNKLEQSCVYDTAEDQKIADKGKEMCRHIFLPEYALCHALLDAQPYYEMCRLDFCTCGSDGDKCMCSSLAKYFQECHRLGGRLQNGWRRDDFCSFRCSGDLVYRDCGSSCPLICKKALEECTDEQCVDGCHCPEGTILHKGRCIKPVECPCQHAGKSYASGKSIQQDCNTCVCDGSDWKCTEEKCESRCSAIGDPHYTTFDGKHYNFMGKCSYYLIYADDFSIEQENVACSGAISEQMGFMISPSSDYPSCTKSLTIRIRGTVLRLKQKKEIILNGKDIYELPISAPGIYAYAASSIYVKVELNNNMTVIWDGLSRVYVDAPLSFLENTKGLCGTFNYNQKDDFLTSEGDIESDVNAFANKWKTSDSCHDIVVGEGLRDPCELFSQRHEKSHALCGRLKSDIFASCHQVLDPEPYFRNCVYDMCYCQNRVMSCLCPAISDYATECAKRNVLVDWRASVRECGINCPNGQVYQICGSSCKRSCVDISYHPTCREQCIEGCNCPPGTTLDSHGQCIAVTACPCVHGGKDYAAGYKDMRGSLTCECFGAKWECRPATEKELVESYKSANIELKPLCSAAANMEYTDCVSECPVTCKNMHAPPKCDTPICKHGCRCKKGYVLDTKSTTCVRKTNCPCHHGGQSYSEGETIKEDCNTCVCDGGLWNCETNECPGICTAWGESHFKTFDDHVYEFHGDCDYILARGGSGKWETFQVTLHNVPCGTSDITCSKSVTLRIGDERVTLTSEKPLPLVVFGSRYILRVVGLYVFLHTDIGITLQWDRITRVYVRADARWNDKIEGLCGNFNGNENDDFRMSDGGPPVAMATTFGDSWRIHNYCPVSKVVENTCDVHPHRKTWAAQKCSVLKSAIFKACHSEVPYEPYLERCIFDSCGCDMGGDCDCFCTAVAAYAQECNTNGIAIAWRSQELCPIQCAPGMKYVPCMSVCPKLTCETAYLYSSVEESCGREVCVDGCEPLPCEQPDQIYDNDRQFQCISKSSCVAQPCRIINGRMYYEGEKVTDPEVTDPCQSCHCRAGDIVCAGKKCAPTTIMPMTLPTTYPVQNVTEGGAASCENGWTNWMNGFSPTYKNGGDYETFDQLGKRLFTFCPPEMMKNIECRTTGTHKHYKETGQNVYCSLPEGLVCKNKDQPVIKLCNDYEIRVFCDCGEGTTETATTASTLTSPTSSPPPTPAQQKPVLTCENVDSAVDGWTLWMNENSPDENPDGDVESRDALRTEYSFCADKYITKLECRQLGTNISFDIVGQYGVVCDMNHGLKCLHSMQTSGKCADYEVRLYCDFDCDKGTTTQAPTTVSEIYKSVSICDGWTEWFNRDSPDDDGSDREVLSSVPNFDKFCRKPVTAQCRNARTKEPFRNTTRQLCTTTGIVCEAGKGPEPCDDFEIRVFCTCPMESLEQVQCTPKWTEYFDTDNPNGRNDEGDFELIEAIRDALDESAAFCPTELITKIECEASIFVGRPQRLVANASSRSEFMKTSKTSEKATSFMDFIKSGKLVSNASDWKYVDYTESGDVGVKCSTLTGLACYNAFQPKKQKCKNYRVRFYCACGTTSLDVSKELATVTIATVTTKTMTALCMPGTSWNDCAYRCDRMCQSFHHQSIKRYLCTRGVGNGTCIPGCVERECAPPYVWRDESTCVKPEDCTCLTEDGQLLPPGEIVNVGECEQCQCIANAIDCTVTKRCGAVTESTTSTTEQELASTPSTTVVPIEIVQDDCWTAWINIDSPNATAADTGDFEVLASMRSRFAFCTEPIAAECRVAATKQSHLETGQTVECDTHGGLVCWNRKNWQQSGCYDYEVRFYCPCENITTTETPATSRPAVSPGPCITGLTQWFSSHVPDRDGEYENIQTVRQAGNVFCANEYVTAMECRVKGTGVPHYKSNDMLVTCNVLEGLSCDARMQDHACSDYEIRLYCQCESTTTAATTLSTSKLTSPTPIVTSMTVEASLPPCSYWSKWINDGKPWFGTGDVEILKKSSSFCRNGELRDIECVLADGNVPYNETQGRRLECSLKKGFMCRNKYQPNKMCLDYKIRYFCGCKSFAEMTTTTVAPSAMTTIIIVPPPTPYPGAPLCDSYFDLISGDDPIPDSALRASSSLNGTYGPQNSRIDGTWAAWVAAQKDLGQYVQADLGAPRLVYGVDIRGNPSIRAWVTSYNVLFGLDGNTFSYVSKSDGSVVTFKGNYDSDEVVRNLFSAPIEARFVRLMPQSWEGSVSLRFGLLGCSPLRIATTASTTTTVTTTTLTRTTPIVCDDQMGLETSQLADEQLKASTVYDDGHAAHYARLNGLGSWLPKTLDRLQFLQVDFGGARVVSGISLQGRPDDVVAQWVTSYYVSYSTDAVTWSNVTSATGQTEVFAGNFDGYTVVTNHFDQSIRARFLRIVPQTWHSWIALRTEIRGCFEPYATTTPQPTLTVQCDDPMGMQGGQITNDMITVTSSLAGNLTDGRRARLDQKEAGSSSSGWIAAKTRDQYLMVDFREPRNLSGIVTQGREKRNEWVRKYMVLYSTDADLWYQAQDENGNDVFVGNVDDNSPVPHMFAKMFSARYVKVVPVEWKRWLSMRLEFIGCYLPYPSELTTTSTAQPVVSRTCTSSLNANLPWDQIEVSSSLSGFRSGPSRLALHTLEDENTGAWVAGQADKRQFIIIDYGKLVDITGIVTQGRNKYPEWVTEYRMFTSPDKSSWTEGVSEETGNVLMSGNFDSDTPVQHYLQTPVKARYVKVVPNKWKDWISMRLDVLGCPEPSRYQEPSESCRGSLNGDVPSDRLEVSSSLAGIRSGPVRLPLDTLETEDTGGWVAGQSDPNQFIVIDYGQPVDITGIVTQGRNGHPEWVTEYRVLMSPDKIAWTMAADEGGNTLIAGNFDSDTKVQHFFEQPMTARYLKLVPYQWKNWISMRLDVLGCPPNVSSTTPSAEDCFVDGPWLSLSVPTLANLNSDYETVVDLIAASHLCQNPVKIECRETTSKKPYDQMGQKVSCDLTRGLVCESAEQTAKTGTKATTRDKCYNYEARIVCWTCGSTTPTPGSGNLVNKPPTCPEVPPYDTGSCPASCPLGFVCDGQQCVDPAYCPCVHNGRFLHPGERFTTSDCEECVCKLNGHSYCVEKSCPLCPYDQPGNLNKSCGCECKTCARGERMCPTNQFCLSESLWCDGLVDCPDDEKECPTTTMPTTPTTACPIVSTPTCSPGTDLVLEDPAAPCPTYVCVATSSVTLPPLPPKKDFCEMSGSYFETFDGYSYKYDICHHVLLQDRTDAKDFQVTATKNCSQNGQCVRHLNVSQDDHVVLVDEQLRVSFDGTVYNDAQLVKIGRKRLGLAVRVIGDSVVIKSQKNSLEVRFDVDSNVRVGVELDLLSEVNGLCGLYSGTPDDDLEMPSGKAAYTVSEFGDSWGLIGSRDVCNTRVCPADVMAKAIAACNQLREAPFDACHYAVDPAYPIQICANSVCECILNTNHTEKECHCKAYLPYVEACELKGVAKIRYWRVKQSCLPSCPPGLVWMDCGSECERTCDTLQDDHHEVQELTAQTSLVSWNATSRCDSERCVAGCFCPAGLVRKGDHCVLPEKCQDCVCKGYGDPHYFSFDGHYFPFQGNCTYILAQDIIAPGQEQHKFEVLATNEDCHEEPLTTCTVALMVIFNGHIAHFRVNESVSFDGVQLYYSDFPFHAYGIHIESIPGRSITFSVPEINLEVRYFELNYGFDVRIPSEVYYNKTEGLCGNCNFDGSDDFVCPYGRRTNDTNDFGFSWIAKPPEEFESVNEICKVKVEEKDKCKPTVEQGLCDRILDEKFEPCHDLVDPQVYLSACKFDVCHSVNPTASLCRSVAEYTRKCAGLGICIQNWRKPDFCPYDCPAGMYYDQCGPACPKSCKDVQMGWTMDLRSRHGKDIDIGHASLLQDDLQQQTMQELFDVCDTDPVDGCFCAGDKIFHNGTCVDLIFCEICDSKGHKVGDTWQTDLCTVCTCTMDKHIECVKTKCPAKPICKEGEQLEMVRAAENVCCDTYECVTEVSKVCPTIDLPRCASGEVIKTKMNPDGCPRYVCECDVSECPPVQVPADLELGEEVSYDKAGCCPVATKICRTDKCPKKLDCGKYRELRERDHSKSKCCKDYYCEAPLNYCVYAHEYEVVGGMAIKVKASNRVETRYKPGDVWSDGLCRRCSCEANNDISTHRCTIELCPQLSDYQDRDEYQWLIEVMPDTCCPRYKRQACIGADGKNYSIGEQWSLAGEKCKSYRCGTAENGDAVRVQRNIQCVKKCQLGFVYTEPLDNSTQCCGTCEPVGCVENGRLYEVGRMWNSTSQLCTTAECIQLEGVVMTRYNSKTCMPVPEGCTKKIRDVDGCCEICNGTISYENLKVCVPQKLKPEKTERMFEIFHGSAQCINKAPISDLMGCVGHCESTSIYSSGKHDFLNFCQCCAPKETVKRTILLDCSDGLKRPVEYSQPTECDCLPCGSSFNQTMGVQLKNIY